MSVVDPLRLRYDRKLPRSTQPTLAREPRTIPKSLDQSVQKTLITTVIWHSLTQNLANILPRHHLPRHLLQSGSGNASTTLQRIVDAMDPIAWTLVGLLMAAVVVGIVFNISTRYSFLRPDEEETTPEVLLDRLKANPSYLPPATALNRLGTEATLELLEYGDRVTAKRWRYNWSQPREEFISLLSQQNAFAPIYALARYYRSDDLDEPATVRIRRTALIHKLGQRRYIEPGENGQAARLRIVADPREEHGDLGFDGPTEWLLQGADLRPVDGPVVEMDPIDFKDLENATVRIRIRRTPSLGGGFRLNMKRRAKMWVVINEEIEWVS